LFLGMQNSAAAIDCPPGTTPQTQPASLTVIQAKMENSLEPYFWGAGIAGTPDGGAVATDTLPNSCCCTYEWKSISCCSE
jgi:hypothetical protein